MWFLIPVLGLGALAYSKFKKKGGAEGLVRQAIVDEVKDRASKYYQQALDEGHKAEDALKQVAVKVKQTEKQLVAKANTIKHKVNQAYTTVVNAGKHPEVAVNAVRKWLTA